jgi:EF-P beta-lysylation protein EpmB
MIPASIDPAQPRGWQAEWRAAITDPAELLAMLGLEDLAARVIRPGRCEFPMRVPRAYAARMRHGDPRDPLLRQVLPLDDECRILPGYVADAVGDLAARASAGVIRKYVGRALLIATGSCAIHCRYCFRRHFPYAEETAAAGRWREAVAWLRAHPDVEEVILSGGDPLSLATARLAELTAELATIEHVRRLRIHTRLPIVLPSRVDRGLRDWLGALPWPVVIVVHANHAREFDAAVDRAHRDLRETGATLLNQSVLLAGVNDDPDALAALSERCFESGVLPYYLHVLDRVSGTAHFDVPAEVARGLVERLRERLPGYLVPRLVREVPGAPSKVPL